MTTTKLKRATKDKVATETTVSLTRALSEPSKLMHFHLWLVGETPLIVHAWSQKAKLAMLSDQVKATKSGREKRDPVADYEASLYEMGDGNYGFPAMGIKNAIVSAAHKDRGVPRSQVERALWVDADMVRVMPAMAGAICDMPLVRIYGSAPEMREDMVRIGAGLNKKANLAYRAQFTDWAIRISGRLNASILSTDALGFLITESGMSAGIGEWRNERKGFFGAYRIATAEEEDAWTAYADADGPEPWAEIAAERNIKLVK